MKSPTPSAMANERKPTHTRHRRVQPTACLPQRLRLRNTGFAGSCGFSVMELMLSLSLGLVVSTAVILIFLSNQETYRHNDNLARLQENARYGFELMGRYIRQAGGIPCGSHLKVANVLTNANANWWSNWRGGIQGFEADDAAFPQTIGTAPGERLAGTDALIIHSASIAPTHRILEHELAAFRIEVANAGIAQTGDILMACDYNQAAIFQVSAAAGNSRNLFHDVNVGSPSNCTADLGFPTTCPNSTPTVFSSNGMVTHLSATAWYIGSNSRGGNSLFQLVLDTNGTTAAPVIEEVAEGIIDLQIDYLEQDGNGNLPDDYVDANNVNDWERVIAARLVVTLETLESIANGEALERRWFTIFTLRNRAT